MSPLAVPVQRIERAATAVAFNAKSYAQIMGANDRVRVGIVGCGDRMKQGDLPAFQQNAKDMNFQIVAVSDIWKMRREQGVDFIEKLTGNRPDQVRNNDELYARKDVDAVINVVHNAGLSKRVARLKPIGVIKG